MLFPMKSILSFFFVSLTVCLSTILTIDQLNAPDRTASYRVGRYQMLYNTICSPGDKHNNARNMYRNIINLL